MRVTFAMPSTGIGFFPGLAKPVVIDAARLDEADARELQALVDAAHLFDRPADRGTAAARGADRRQYAITVEQGGRHCELLIADPVEDPDLQRLVRFLEALAAAQRAQRPGPGTP